VLAIVAAALFPAAGQAGVIAALSVEDPPTDSNPSVDFNVHVIDPLDATRTFPLPAAAVTPQVEEWPQLSGDASRLLLGRAGVSPGGAYTLLEVDRVAGTVATVAIPSAATPFEGTYGLSPDAHTIITTALALGNTTAGPPTAASATVFDSTAMPAGPLPQVAAPQIDLPDPGQFSYARIDVQGRPDVSNERRYVWAVSGTTVAGFGGVPSTIDLITGTVGGQIRETPLPFVNGAIEPLENPVLTPGNASTITFDNGRSLLQAVLGATPTFKALQLPNVSFTVANETFPRWTSSGRYLAWISRPSPPSAGAAVDTKIFVYDTQTQQLVRPDGRSVGSHEYAFGLTVAETPSVVASFALVPAKPITPSVNIPPNLAVDLVTTLRKPTSVGILVERVAGTTKLLGRTVPRLKVVGRVPLGRHHKGANRIPWNGKVAGHRLTKGTYKITMRAIAADGLPSDLSQPVTLRVR